MERLAEVPNVRRLVRHMLLAYPTEIAKLLDLEARLFKNVHQLTSSA